MEELEHRQECSPNIPFAPPSPLMWPWQPVIYEWKQSVSLRLRWWETHSWPAASPSIWSLPEHAWLQGAQPQEKQPLLDPSLGDSVEQSLHQSARGMCVCVCVRACTCTRAFSHVGLFVAPLSMGFFRQEHRSAVAISYSRGSSGDRTHISCVSCVGRWILYHCPTWEAPWSMSPSEKSIFLTGKCLRFRSGFLLRNNLVYQVMLDKSWKFCTEQTFRKRSFYFPITFMRTLCAACPSAHPSPRSWGENKCRKNSWEEEKEKPT